MTYEVIQEIKNHCKQNAMRDIYFFEAEIDNPSEWIRQREPKAEETECETLPGGFRFRVWNSGLLTEYTLTKEDTL